MKHQKHPAQGFTVMELLCLLGVLGTLVTLLANLAIVDRASDVRKSQLIMAVNNARQIHLAAMAMATDGAANDDRELGWPGDLKAHGKIATVSDYVNVLVRHDYLRPADLKVFSAAGVNAYPGGTLNPGDNGGLVPPFEEKNTAFKVFLVKDKDPAPTVFLATKNYTYNTPLNDPQALPFGDDGFVVLRKGGDAAIYKKEQAQDLQVLGKLPGGGKVESAENCLNPGPSPQ